MVNQNKPFKYLIILTQLLAIQTHQIERHFLSTLSKKIGLLCSAVFCCVGVHILCRSFSGAKQDRTGQIQDKQHKSSESFESYFRTRRHHCVMSLSHFPPATNKTTMKFVRGVALLVATVSRSTTTAFTVPAASSSSVVVAGSRFGAASVCQGELFTYQKCCICSYDRYEFEAIKTEISVTSQLVLCSEMIPHVVSND
jgi:hypothetical protein